MMETIGTRIRALRDSLGIDQTEFAKRTGLKHRQTVGAIESDERAVKASELVSIASVLRVDVSTILSGPATPALQVLWRAEPADGRILQAEFLKRCERHRRLLGLLGKEATRRLPSFTVDLARMTYSNANELAADVGRSLELGRRPAAVLEDAIQDQFDVLVWYEDRGSSRSAACCRGDFGSAILLPRSSVPWRRNFDIAHELFHLLTWDSLNPTSEADEFALKRAEKLAESFAAALLMPESLVNQEINARAVDGTAQLADVVPLAAELEVSLSALLYRLLNLRYLPDKETVERLSDEPRLQGVVRDLRQDERRPAPSLPKRYVSMAYSAWSRGRLSKVKLAEYLETTLQGLPQRLAEFGIAGPDESAVENDALLDVPLRGIVDVAVDDAGYEDTIHSS